MSDAETLVRDLATLVRTNTEMRNAAICTMRQEGATLAQIATVAKMSGPGIAKIIHRGGKKIPSHE